MPALVSAGVFLVTSRVLGPLEFGLVAFAAGVSSFASIAVPTGFGDALLQREELSDDHLSSVFWLCLAASVVAILVISIAAFPVASSYHQPILRYLIPLIATKTLFDALGTVPSALLARRMSFGLVAARTTIASFVAAAMCLILLAFGFGLWALAISQVSAAAAGSVAALASAKWAPHHRPTVRAIRELSHFGAFSSGTRLLQFIYPEQVIIGALLGPVALGLYGFARRLFSLLNDMISGALNAVSTSLFASLQGERDKLREAFFVATFASAAVSFPVFIGLANVAPDLMPLVFGAKWLPAITVIQALCILGLITSIGVIQASLINSQGRPDWWFFYLLGKQLLLLLTIVGTHRFGITTVVWGMVIASLLIWPVTTVKSAELAGVPLRGYLRTLGGPAAASAIMFAALFILRTKLLPADPLFRLLGLVLAGAISYASALLAISWPSLKQLLQLLKTKTARS